METAPLGFFAGFNARHMGAEQVAQSFVPSTRFTQLLGQQNSLLIGARGSGKTHMLKMLQPKALNSWTHESANAIRRRVNYWGIFVPADEAWSAQIAASTAAIPMELQSEFQSAIFCTHVQRSVIDCFLQLTHDRPNLDVGFARVDMRSTVEAELCRTIAGGWKLAPRIHSFLGLRQSLVDRASDLYEFADRGARSSGLLENCQTHAIQSSLRALNAFDASIGRYEGKWCFLFDELEIAPADVQQMLFRALRSTDQKLLFKLALSPSTQAASIFNNILGPTAGNDFDEISLYSDPRECEIFCESLWMALAAQTSVQGKHPANVLGHSTFHAPEDVNPYARRGKWQQASSSLAKKDPSYVRFLQEHQLNPDELERATASQKNAVVRKIGPLVGFRDFMLKEGKAASPSLRLDKSRPAQLYSGWEALCLISEGNPRWFTGIAKALLIRLEHSIGELSKATQYSSITSASKKFKDYVATIPSLAKASADSDEGGLKGLVDMLSSVIRGNVLLEDFSLDPILSFEVDSEMSEDIKRAVFDGLYSGAFIPVGDVDRQFAFSADLSRVRLRLTYLLAPLETLPLRTGKSRGISWFKGRTELPRTGANRRRSRVLQKKRGPVELQSKLFSE